MQKNTSLMDNYYDNYEFFNLSILDSPIDRTKIEIEEIINNFWGDKIIFNDLVNLNKVSPPPIKSGGAHFIKILIWEPRYNPNQTAFFVNLSDAYSSLIYNWNKKFNKRSITVRLTNDTISEYPFHSFNYRTVDNLERVVYSQFDSKWIFCEKGPIQDFEKLEYYKRKKIRDRLNTEIINEYMSKLGFKIWTEDFYSSDRQGIYFEQLSWRNK